MLQFRARHRYLLLFGISATLLTLLRLMIDRTGVPEAVFEGLFAGGFTALVMRWWDRRKVMT